MNAISYPPPAEAIRRILVIKSRNIGDVLLTGPLVGAFGVSGAVAEQARTYLRLAFLGTTPIFLQIFYTPTAKPPRMSVFPTVFLHLRTPSAALAEHGPISKTPDQRAICVVARGGVEPPTFRFSVGRSYQLSYLAAVPRDWRPRPGSNRRPPP